MRVEIKIALGFFAIGTSLKYLITVPEFISGLLLGLSLFFMIIGLLSENTYSKFRKRQIKKLSLLRKLVKLNK